MSQIKENIADFDYDQMNFILKGLKPYRKDQIFDAVNKFKSYEQITNLPKDLIEKLTEKYTDLALSVEKTFEGKDQTQKYIFRLNDNNSIEGVFMPHTYGNTLCVSTQVGCR